MQREEEKNYMNWKIKYFKENIFIEFVSICRAEVFTIYLHNIEYKSVFYYTFIQCSGGEIFYWVQFFSLMAAGRADLWQRLNKKETFILNTSAQERKVDFNIKKKSFCSSE